MTRPKIIFLMGPTASGKTPLAVELMQRLPLQIISVDSAMIYRGMDIGTAKPTADILKIAPHRLINILDPKEIYSAGQFRTDAINEIDAAIKNNKIPLLVGGTMMYFRTLINGIASLPKADNALRERITNRAQEYGWEALHQELSKIDPKAAARIKPTDAQRIQRALEVYYLTGKTISEYQEQETKPDFLNQYEVQQLALFPNDRANLHKRIASRFETMLKNGFLEEVASLYERGDLSASLPSIRSVGYRQAWDHLAGKLSKTEMQDKAIAATRQLAKRQMTWLRSWPNAIFIDPEDKKIRDKTIRFLLSFF